MPRSRTFPVAMALALCACAPAVQSGVFSEMPLPPASGDVAIFSTKTPACPYDEVGLVHVQRRHGFTRLQTMVDAMRDRARDMGGHAVVGVGFTSNISGNVNTDLSVSVSKDDTNGLSGTVIRFKDSGCRQ